jgi:hypothetical protein
VAGVLTYPLKSAGQAGREARTPLALLRPALVLDRKSYVRDLR